MKKKNIKQILFMIEDKKERTRERKKERKEKEKRKNQVKYNCLSLDTIDSRLVFPKGVNFAL